ncbi:MAG: hypothetical protein RRZ69_04650, partial [Clostridia bacterium]
HQPLTLNRTLFTVGATCGRPPNCHHSRYASAIKTCHKRVKGRSSLSGFGAEAPRTLPLSGFGAEAPRTLPLSGLGGSPIRVWGGSPENTASPKTPP